VVVVAQPKFQRKASLNYVREQDAFLMAQIKAMDGGPADV